MKIRMRLPKDEQAYQQHKKLHQSTHPFANWKERCIEEFTHWIIIKNNFPWTRIAKVHHILIPKRVFAHNTDMNEFERSELSAIQQKVYDRYDMYVENTQSMRSVHTHFHIHLVSLLEETNPEYQILGNNS